jgi:cysteinyl-tRNA synthetase
MAQYGSFQNFTWDQLEAAKNARKALIKKIQKLFDTHSKVIVDSDMLTPYETFKDQISSKYVGDALEDVIAALMDDLNTPQLIALLNQSLNALNKVEEVDRKELFIALYWLEKKLLKI